MITKNLIPELKKWILAKKIALEAALAPSSASIVATGITLSDKIKNRKLFKKYFKNYYQNKIKNLTKESLEAKEQRLLKISLVSSAISLSFQYTIEQIEKHINDIQNQIKKSVELYFGPHEVFNDFKNWHGKIWSRLSFTNEIISWVLSHYIPGNFPQAWYDRYLFYLKKTTSLKTFHFISLGNDLLAIWLNVDEIKKLDKALDYLDSKEEEFKDALETLNSGIESLREDKWVVVKESRKSDYYSRGGKGGKNLLFKNLKTDEVKTLEEMLEYSREELKLWGLQKVYNHKTGWYIRSIPNKDKSDNLG
ncbi:hypothetical protein NPA08_01435 [Mycoplasmopsis citelli]|uniref:hypothetical protein n=1 Tax=Mycoplasmopsis citelli TaxID=171281 RepID=UPI002113A04C|nr:hypothetical protein [Mycoplasmopsis citelli]UUD36479.1 hypothetical protein NPA08_01435 [Mycoplasmopsis citelli]